MSPEAYLRLSIACKAYRRKAWLYSLFAITQETDAQRSVKYPGKLEWEPYGVFTYAEDLTQIRLDLDPSNRQPLFTPASMIHITQDLIPSLREPVLETSVGTLLINLICLLDAFGAKFPYQNGKLKISDLEDQIAARLKSTPSPDTVRDPNAYYVDEYLKFSTGVSFLESLTQVIAHSITRVGLLPAPGRKAFKAQLLKEKYQGKLHDPVLLSQFEKELSDYDKAYLKQDPAYGAFMSGKVSNARMKLYMTLGGEEDGFSNTQSITPVIPSLEDGTPLEPEAFTALVNISRYGSFSRGAETVNGGVVAKSLGRAADSWRVVKGDCKTPLGVRRIYARDETKFLVGRYLQEKTSPVLVETPEQAAAYTNRAIIVRSPQYCRQPGTATCEVCAGLALSKYPEGLSIPLMEVSGGILNDSLKKMHNNALATATMDLVSTIT